LLPNRINNQCRNGLCKRWHKRLIDGTRQRAGETLPPPEIGMPFVSVEGVLQAMLVDVQIPQRHKQMRNVEHILVERCLSSTRLQA
jgi:hypothetical protein